MSLMAEDKVNVKNHTHKNYIMLHFLLGTVHKIVDVAVERLASRLLM